MSDKCLDFLFRHWLLTNIQAVTKQITSRGFVNSSLALIYILDKSFQHEILSCLDGGQSPNRWQEFVLFFVLGKK